MTETSPDVDGARGGEFEADESEVRGRMDWRARTPKLLNCDLSISTFFDGLGIKLFDGLPVIRACCRASGNGNLEDTVIGFLCDARITGAMLYGSKGCAAGQPSMGRVTTRSSQSWASASGQTSSAHDFRAPSPRAVNPPAAVDAACAAMPH